MYSFMLHRTRYSCIFPVFKAWIETYDMLYLLPPPLWYQVRQLNTEIWLTLRAIRRTPSKVVWSYVLVNTDRGLFLVYGYIQWCSYKSICWCYSNKTDRTMWLSDCVTLVHLLVWHLHILGSIKHSHKTDKTMWLSDYVPLVHLLVWHLYILGSKAK